MAGLFFLANKQGRQGFCFITLRTCSDVTFAFFQAPKLTDYESLASKGQALIDKGGKVNKIGNQINKLALQYQDRELAIRSIMRGMEQSEKAGEYNMADFQTMFAIKGNKPVTIEQILDAPVDPNNREFLLSISTFIETIDNAAMAIGNRLEIEPFLGLIIQ